MQLLQAYFRFNKNHSQISSAQLQKFRKNQGVQFSQDLTPK